VVLDAVARGGVAVAERKDRILWVKEAVCRSSVLLDPVGRQAAAGGLQRSGFCAAAG
jgi:hypothetical protein